MSQMALTNDELAISEEAHRWIKRNEKIVINTFANPAEHVPDARPTTLFMAGSPGAGKTEISKRLIARFEQKPIRIDADEIRELCPGYNGQNAHVFQKAANKGVNILYDHALRKNVNVILDGTFAYDLALANIKRSLDHRRKVELFFVYQNPLQAWDFTKKREMVEQRKVSKDVFIDAFFKSQRHANQAKAKFGAEIELNVLIKDFEKDLEQLELNVSAIDPYIPRAYSRDELVMLIT